MTDNVAQINNKVSINRSVNAGQPLTVNNRLTNSADSSQQGSNASLLNKRHSESWFALANDSNKGSENTTRNDIVYFSIEQGQLTTGCDLSQIKADCYSLIPIWCNLCHRCGHLSRDCQDSAPIDGARRRICANCCDTSHTDHNNDCPSKLCSTCLERGHHPSECSKPSRKSMVCHRCNLKGHERLFCPMIWREYFLTTSISPANGRIPNKQSLMQMITNPKKFCCFCAGQGHFHFECHLNGENTQGAVGYQSRNYEKKSRPNFPKGLPLQQNGLVHNNINRQHSRNSQNFSNGFRNKPFSSFIPQKQNDAKFGRKLANGYTSGKSISQEQNNANHYGFDQSRGFTSQPLSTLSLGHPVMGSLPNSFVSTSSTPSSTVTASNFGADAASKMNIFPDIQPHFISSVNTNSGTPYFGAVLNPALTQAPYPNPFPTSELTAILNGLSITENDDQHGTSNHYADGDSLNASSNVTVNGTPNEVPNLLSEGPPIASHSQIDPDHSSLAAISISGATKGPSATSKHEKKSNDSLDDS